MYLVHEYNQYVWYVPYYTLHAEYLMIHITVNTYERWYVTWNIAWYIVYDLTDARCIMSFMCCHI